MAGAEHGASRRLLEELPQEQQGGAAHSSGSGAVKLEHGVAQQNVILSPLSKAVYGSLYISGRCTPGQLATRL